MTSITRNVAPVKSTVTIFAPEFTRELRNPRFGFGLAPARRLPVGPSLADAIAARGACPSTAVSLEDAYGHFLDETLSPAEYRELQAEFNAAVADRHAMPEPIAEVESDSAELLEAIAAAYDATDHAESWEEAEMGEARMLAPVVTESDVARPAPRRRHRRVNAAKARRKALARC